MYIYSDSWSCPTTWWSMSALRMVMKPQSRTLWFYPYNPVFNQVIPVPNTVLDDTEGDWGFPVHHFSPPPLPGLLIITIPNPPPEILSDAADFFHSQQCCLIYVNVDVPLYPKWGNRADFNRKINDKSEDIILSPGHLSLPTPRLVRWFLRVCFPSPSPGESSYCILNFALE